MKMNKIFSIVAWSAAIAFFPSLLLAESSIKTQVQVRGPGKPGVFAVGFSVNGSRSGSMGTVATKSGPAGANYLFGLRTNTGKSVSCGSKRLTQDSIVVVTFNGTSCTSSVHPWKS